MASEPTQGLDDEDVSALKEMAEWWRESNMTRRAALGLATGAGAAAAGAGGFMTGRASADASTSDNDGDVGEPDDRVDVWADGVDANSIGVDELFTAPAGVLLNKSSNQSIPDNTITEITWGQADELNPSAPAFADLSNNQIVVPNGDYSRVRLTAGIWFTGQVQVDLLDIQQNGGDFDTGAGMPSAWSLADSQSVTLTSGWVPANSGDTFSMRIRQISGGSKDLAANARTWFQLEAF